jgi:hypothetical protein
MKRSERRAYMRPDSMPGFVFQIDGDPEKLRIDLPSIAAAKSQAARYAGGLLCDAAETFWEGTGINLTVSDDSGMTLFALSISGTDAPVIRVFPKISL